MANYSIFFRSYIYIFANLYQLRNCRVDKPLKLLLILSPAKFTPFYPKTIWL